MNREEQKQILGFIERALTSDRGAPLPPMDLEADAIIRALFVRNPEAAYRITKLAMTLESELEALRAATGSGGERRLPGRVGWWFARRKAAANRREPQLPAMEVTTNG
jgi:hypothetical protein